MIVGCLLVYAVLAAALFWPALPWDRTRLPNGGYGDPAQTTWYLAWVPFALRHGLDVFRTNYIDYPTGVDLADNTSVPLLGLLATPVTLALGPVASYNLLLRLAFACSAGSMFLVLRTWCRWPAAFAGGLLYGFGPYMASQGHGDAHLDLAFVPIPPLIVWCLYELLVTRRRRPGRMGVLLGALAGAQALIDPELLSLLAIVVAVGLVALAIRTRSDLRLQFGHLVRAAVPAVIVFGIVTAYMFWWMLVAPGHLVGPVLRVGQLQVYRADLLGTIVPTTNQLIAPTSLANTAAGFVHSNFTENSAYLGLPLVILIVLFGVLWRRERVVLVAALLAFVAFILSLGSPLTIDAHTTGIPMPEALLTHFPILDSVVPARFALDVSLFATIALAVGGDRLVRAFASRDALRRGGVVFWVVAFVAAAALVLPRAPFATPVPQWSADTEATLDVIPPGSVVLTYPFTVPHWTEAMVWQAADGMRFRLMGGYATVQGGGNAGIQNPPLLAPPFVQEYFLAAQDGASSYYPAPPSTGVGVDARQALCSFLSSYAVGAVVFWDAGADPKEILQLFRSALGTPQATHGRTVLVWLTGSGRCP